MSKIIRITAILCALGAIPLILMGCDQSKSAKTESNSSSKVSSTKPYYQTMIEKGLSSVADGDTNKAQAYFENACDANRKSQKAKTYLAQVKVLNRAVADYKSNDYEGAKMTLDKAPSGKNASSALTTKITQLKDKVSKAQASESSSQIMSSSNQVDSSSSSVKATGAEHKQANDLREILASNQDFSSSVLESIPDAELIEAASVGGTATNSGLAQTAGILLKKYPDLK